MRQGVQRDSAFPPRRVVAQPGGHPGVRKLVRRCEKPQQSDIQNRDFQVHAELVALHDKAPQQQENQYRHHGHPCHLAASFIVKPKQTNNRFGGHYR